MSKYTKNNGLFFVAIGAYLLSKFGKNAVTPSEPPTATSGYTPIALNLDSPTSQSALRNIEHVYGKDFTEGTKKAVAESSSVREALDAIGKLPTGNNLRNSSPPIEFNTTGGERPTSPYDVDFLKKFTPIVAPVQNKVVVSALSYDRLAEQISKLREKAAGSRGSRKEYFDYAADREQAELNNYIRG